MAAAGSDAASVKYGLLYSAQLEQRYIGNIIKLTDMTIDTTEMIDTTGIMTRNRGSLHTLVHVVHETDIRVGVMITDNRPVLKAEAMIMMHETTLQQ